jgi:hypothetical protein
MVDKVQIVQEDNNPSLEEQSKQQDEVSTQEAQTTETSNERPSWLPEKFSNAEELAKAYGALENKLSGKAEDTSNQDEKTETKIQEPKEVDNKAGQLDKFYQEYADKGELSNTSYDELANIGLTKEVVDAYISGQQAMAEQKANSIMSTVGGKEQYTEMVNWASKNLAPEEIKAFNNTIDNGSLEQAQLAIAGVQAKYSQNNNEPNLFSGNKAEANIGYRSVGEMLADINDPRYTTDSAFRADVENKVKHSNTI